MSLRDFMTGMEGLNSGLKIANDNADSIRKSAAMKEFAAKSPGLASEFRNASPERQGEIAGQYNNLALSADVAKGDPIADQMAKTLAGSMGKSAMDNSTMTQAQIDALSSGDQNEINKQAATITNPKAQQFYLGQANVNNRQKNMLGFQGGVQTNKQATKSYDVLNKTEDAFREQDYKLKEINQALDTNTTLGDNIAFGYVARSIAQEKGPLTDTDISRIQGVTGIQGTLAEFKSKFNGDVYEKLSPQAKALVKQVVSNNAKNFAAKKAESLAADMNGLYQSQNRLRDDEGNPTGILKQRIDQYKKQGIPVEFDAKTKTFNVGVKKSTHTGASADLMKVASSIQNPTTKAQYMGYLSKNQDKEFSDEEVAHLKSKMQGGQ